MIDKKIILSYVNQFKYACHKYLYHLDDKEKKIFFACIALFCIYYCWNLIFSYPSIFRFILSMIVLLPPLLHIIIFVCILSLSVIPLAIYVSYRKKNPLSLTKSKVYLILALIISFYIFSDTTSSYVNFYNGTNKPTLVSAIDARNSKPEKNNKAIKSGFNWWRLACAACYFLPNGDRIECLNECSQSIDD